MSSDCKFKVIFYASFLIMFIIRSSNCINTLIELPQIFELMTFTSQEKSMCNYMEPMTDEINETNIKLIIRREFFIYVLRMRPSLFINLNDNWEIYNYIFTNIESNDTNESGLLSFNQWFQIRTFYYLNKDFYNSDRFKELIQRMPKKPLQESPPLAVYHELCRSNMNANSPFYLSAIENYFTSRTLPPEIENYNSIQFNVQIRNLKNMILGHLINMMQCTNIDWFIRLFNTLPIYCESYLSYNIRVIAQKLMVIPQEMIKNVYDLPDNFNLITNYEKIYLEGLEDSEKQSCIFMFVLYHA